MNDGAFDISELLGAFRRRAWLLVASIVIITPIVLLTALLLPPYYSSTARILVQSQQIPQDLIRSTVQVDSSERLALIQQRLTTRNNLLDMAERLGLYEDQPRMSQTEIVEELRKAISVEEVPLVGQQATRRRDDVQASAFTVTYHARAPVIAARVANELVTMVLQENIENRSRRASQTRDFLLKKKEDLAAALTAAEQAISEYKAEHGDALPETLDSRQKELLDLQERLFSLQSSRVEQEERRRALELALNTGLSINGATSPLSSEQQQLQQLRQQLATLRGVYASSHPKMRGLRASIASLEAQIEADAKSGATPQDPVKSAEAARRIEIENSIALIDRQLPLLTAEIDSLTERMSNLRASIAATPDVEIAISGLERRRDDIAEQLRQATLKEAEAADGEELEINRQAERFEILEQAQIPEEPDSPPRKLISAAGFGGSIFFGIGLIILVELLNRTVRTARGLTAQVGIAPIVTVPLIRTSAETTRKRLTSAFYILLVIGLGAGLLVIIDLYIAPLDRLIANLLDDAKLTPLVEEARDKFAALLTQGEVWLRRLIGGAL